MHPVLYSKAALLKLLLGLLNQLHFLFLVSLFLSLEDLLLEHGALPQLVGQQRLQSMRQKIEKNIIK